MLLNIVKKIPIGIDATSIAITDDHVVTTTAMDDFCVMSDINQTGKGALSAQQFTGPAGRNQVLFSGKNTVVALMNGRSEALIAYSGLEMTVGFGHREINNVSVSADGESVAFFLEDLSLPGLDEMYYGQVDNIYIVKMAQIAMPGLEVGSGQCLDLGLKVADSQNLIEAGMVTTMRPRYTVEGAPYYSVLAGAFSEDSQHLFVLMHEAETELLMCYLFTNDGQPVEMDFFDDIKNTGENNRCCVIGNVAYSIANKRSILYAYNMEEHSTFAFKLEGKYFIDIAVFKGQLYALVWSQSSRLYELLDDQFNVITYDSNYGALAASEEYLMVSSKNIVYVFK